MKHPHTPVVHTVVDTPLGSLRLAATPLGLAGLWFADGHRHGPTDATMAAWRRADDDPLLADAHRQVLAFLAGSRQHFDLPLDPLGGTPFQQEVWQALLNVPYGHHLSYAQLAQRLGRPQAARAVGAAVGRNPISIVVPCHRVLGSGGALTGYAGGLARKTRLLDLERTHANTPA